MTDAATLPYYPFDNEAQRAAFEQLDWEAAGRATRERLDAFFARFPANPNATWEPRTSDTNENEGVDWEAAGRAARERMDAFFARYASGTC